MQVRKRDVIPIANAGLGCVGRNHAMTDIVEQKSDQQMVIEQDSCSFDSNHGLFTVGSIRRAARLFLGQPNGAERLGSSGGGPPDFRARSKSIAKGSVNTLSRIWTKC